MTSPSEFDQICADGDVAGPASANAIEQAQRELGGRFSDDYTKFLREEGALLGNGVQIYGLFEGDPNGPRLWESVTEANKKLRACRQAGSERAAFVAISDDGAGIYFFLDTSAAPHTKIWAIGPGVEKIVSSSLSEFAVAYAQGRVAY